MSAVEFRVNEDDGSVPDDVMREFYSDAWEPDFLTTQQIREMMSSGMEDPDSSSNSSVLLTILKSIKIGSDLNRIQAPMFVQRPKSGLDIAGDICNPTPGLLNMYMEQDPIKRVLLLFQWCTENMSFSLQNGLGFVKPYNPILGEQFSCTWEHENSTTHMYAEQISHHPPVSAVMLYNTGARFYSQFTTKTVPVFLGNHVTMSLHGDSRFIVFVRDEQTGEYKREEYVMKKPGLTLRGLLIGSCRLETASQTLELTCKETGVRLKAKFKGDNFKGKVYRSGKKVRRLMGSMQTHCTVIDLEKYPGSKSEKDGVLFCDYSTAAVRSHMKTNKPILETTARDSRRVWFAANYAFRKMKDMDLADKYKSMVENHQRMLRKQPGFKFEPDWFELTGVKRDGVALCRFKKLDQIDMQCAGRSDHMAKNEETNDDDDDNVADLD